MKMALMMPRATAGSMGDMATMAGTVVVVTGDVTTAVVPPVVAVVPDMIGVTLLKSPSTAGFSRNESSGTIRSISMAVYTPDSDIAVGTSLNKLLPPDTTVCRSEGAAPSILDSPGAASST